MVVSQSGRNGLFRRALVIPDNPHTADQMLVRNFLSNSAANWSSLTESNRLAWIAAAGQEQSKPRLGQSGPLTGIQLYTKINCSLLLVGEAAVDTPPAKPEFPQLPISSLVITNTGGTIALKLTASGDVETNTMVRASEPVSAGIYKQKDLRYIGTASAVSNGFSVITTDYTNEYGVPAVGKKIFVTVNHCIDGWQDIAHKFSAVVPGTS